MTRRELAERLELSFLIDEAERAVARLGGRLTMERVSDGGWKASFGPDRFAWIAPELRLALRQLVMLASAGGVTGGAR
jgi:hypothetical protein